VATALVPRSRWSKSAQSWLRPTPRLKGPRHEITNTCATNNGTSNDGTADDITAHNAVTNYGTTDHRAGDHATAHRRQSRQ
jgi:hypothetical protein